jgi:hypothetical protein
MPQLIWLLMTFSVTQLGSEVGVAVVSWSLKVHFVKVSQRRFWRPIIAEKGAGRVGHLAPGKAIEKE